MAPEDVFYQGRAGIRLPGGGQAQVRSYRLVLFWSADVGLLLSILLQGGAFLRSCFAPGPGPAPPGSRIAARPNDFRDLGPRENSREPFWAKHKGTPIQNPARSAGKIFEDPCWQNLVYRMVAQAQVRGPYRLVLSGVQM